MTFILQNTETKEIFTCLLLNHYELEYYGVKCWSDEEAARNFVAEQKLSEHGNWILLEIDEAQLKSFNVKLKNDPRNRLIWHEGVAKVQREHLD